jgi:flagellar hook protein FlgE
MGVTSSMSTAISGLESNGRALSVITDNIVNANTTGFKSSRAEFQTILAQDMLASTGAEMGRGVTVGGITTLFNQGPITMTDRGTDVAINGNGFFVLRGDNRGYSYTRDGAFRFDKDGWLTNLSGQRVQAYSASTQGKITGRLTDIRIPYTSIQAKPSRNIELQANLDARLPIKADFDVNRPDDTSQFTAGIQVFDSIGNSHGLAMYFNKTSDSTWEWHAMTPGESLAGGTAGTQGEVARGTLNFNEDGKLQSSEQELVNTSFSNGAKADQSLQFNFGDPIEKGGTGEMGSTQYGSKSAMFRNVQDGFAAGYLVDTAIDTEGNVTGIYNNGQNRLLGQIAMARFEAPERLSKLGENQYRETFSSGQASIGKPNTNGRGAMLTKSLEGSNVDLAKEFVDMIKTQRGFQASAKSINTANEMLDEVINIKRT